MELEHTDDPLTQLPVPVPVTVPVTLASGRRFCMGVILAIWILSPFFLLQQFSLYKPFVIKPLFLDQWISYEPLAIYPYLLFLLTLIWVFFKTSHLTFIKLCKSIALVSLISHLCFFFIPTGIITDVPPVIDTDAVPILNHWLDTFRNPRNSLPSLYSAIATLSLCAWWKESVLIKITALLWTVIFLWAALALKQNYLISEVAGMALALAVWIFASTAVKAKGSDKK